MRTVLASSDAAARLAEPAVPQRLAGVLALSTADDQQRSATIGARGRRILALGLLYESHDIDRFPRVQDCLSYSRF